MMDLLVLGMTFALLLVLTMGYGPPIGFTAAEAWSVKAGPSPAACTCMVSCR